MTTVNVPDGSQIAQVPPASSLTADKFAIVPKTVADLLVLLEQQGMKGMPMLRTTSGVLATFLSATHDRLTIQSVHDTKDQFRSYLTERRYAENSIRTYVNHAKILLNAAGQFGWVPSEEIPPAWEPVLNCGRSRKLPRNLVKHLMVLKPEPIHVSDTDVNAWAMSQVKAGYTIANIDSITAWYWRTVKKLGLAGPHSRVAVSRYKIPLDQFPSRLKSEVQEVLRWKQANFSPGRPSKGKHRAVSAHALERAICQLYGFAVNVRGDANIACLSDLIQESLLTEFVTWRINERNTGGYGNRIALVMIKAAIRHHPIHRKIDLSWFDGLLNSIPEEPESEVRRRKAAKFLDYHVIEGIPEKIRETRMKSPASSLELHSS